MYFFQYFYIFVIMCLFCKGALETTWLERRRSIWWPTPAPSRSATQPISHFSPEREVSGRKTCSSSRNIISPYFCKKSTSRDISSFAAMQTTAVFACPVRHFSVMALPEAMFRAEQWRAAFKTFSEIQRDLGVNWGLWNMWNMWDTENEICET